MDLESNCEAKLQLHKIINFLFFFFMGVVIGLIAWKSLYPKSALIDCSQEALPKSDIQTCIKRAEYLTKDFFEFNTWDNVIFINHEKNNITTWKSLSNYEKTIYCILMAKKTTIFLYEMQSLLDKDKSLYQEEIKEMTLIRMQFAVEYEKFTENQLSIYEEFLPRTEARKIFESIKKLHKSLGLKNGQVPNIRTSMF